MPATEPARVPDFLYGTAWKEERTPALTGEALRAGFRGIDTANQRRHYFEAGVGEALAAAYRAGIVTRADLFLQTKFTYEGGQDHRLPYDPAASLSTQVAQSMASSLEHLGTDHVDSYVLHGPASRDEWTEYDAEVWAAMVRERDAGHTRLLGVSNVSLEQLEQMTEAGAEAPH
ncbi:MAG: aldo/keto reductase, partial [Candidatus Rokuibacteriota bacterium]